MLYHEFKTIDEALKAIENLNSHWGFDTTNPNSSQFTNEVIINFNGLFYIMYDSNWTYILGTPVEIKIQQE